MATSMNDSPALLELARQLISEVESMLEKIAVTAEEPIASFPYDTASNYLYVLYSATGIPLRAGVVAGVVGKRDVGRLQTDVQRMASSGLISSYKTIEMGSERLARRIGQWFSDLFGAALPLTDVGMTSQGLPAAAVESAATSEEGGTRRRGRPAGGSKGAKKSRGAARRRGRPRKNAVTPSSEGDAGTATPARRGRPRKGSASEEAPTAASPARRRGRPSRSENAATESTTTSPPRRGRRPKGATPEEVVATPPKRRGRPRTSGKGEGTPKRRGRKPGNVGELSAPAPEADATYIPL
jgi:hypothetical protein